MATEHMRRMGERIRQRRDQLGLTQHELAGMLPGRVSGNRVSLWERGEHAPNPGNLEALARALQVTVGYFHSDAPADNDNGDAGDVLRQLGRQQDGDQLDRLEQKVNALLDRVNVRLDEIAQALDAHDQRSVDRFDRVAGDVQQLQDVIAGRFEALRVETVDRFAAALGEARQEPQRRRTSPGSARRDPPAEDR